MGCKARFTNVTDYSWISAYRILKYISNDIHFSVPDPKEKPVILDFMMEIL